MSNRRFRKGDYMAECDRTGMTFHRSEMRREWNGALVHKDYWEPRHPQDLIRAKADKQVPDSEVRPSNSITPETTTLGANAVKTDTSLTVASTNNMSERSSIGIVLNNGDVHWSLIESIDSGTTLTIADALELDNADSGNTVYYYQHADFLSTAVTTADL